MKLQNYCLYIQAQNLALVLYLLNGLLQVLAMAMFHVVLHIFDILFANNTRLHRHLAIMSFFYVTMQLFFIIELISTNVTYKYFV